MQKYLNWMFQLESCVMLEDPYMNYWYGGSIKPKNVTVKQKGVGEDALDGIMGHGRFQLPSEYMETKVLKIMSDERTKGEDLKHMYNDK